MNHPPHHYQPPLRRRFGPVGTAVIVLTAWMACQIAQIAPAAGLTEGFDGPETRAVVPPTTGLRLLNQRIEQGESHAGTGAETLVLEAAEPTVARLLLPLEEAAVIDEFTARLWVQCDHPGVRLACRVRLPAARTASGAPLEVSLAGPPANSVGRWQELEVARLPQLLARQLPALRAEHGADVSPAAAVITGLAVEIPLGGGRCTASLDALTVTGLIPAAAMAGQSPGNAVRLTAGTQPVPPTASGSATAAGLVRGVLEVQGRPFFPRAIDHNGEPLAGLARLGCNCVRLRQPASADLLDEAARAGIWIICPPPTLPEVDLREPDKLPAFSARWDRVLLWDMGSGLSAEDIPRLAEQVRRLRICDRRQGRPVIASADSGLRGLSRHIDMLVARRAVLGTSLELTNYLTWLEQQPRLARPGTPLLATLATELDARTAAQAALLSGTGIRGLPVDEESLLGAAFTTLAAGSRGILFRSKRRLDATDAETLARAAAIQRVNLELEPLAAWAASGRYAADAETSDPDVRAMVVEASRSRMVLVWRAVQGGQVMARHYRGDIPRQEQPLTLLVPGVPEAHRPWEITHSTLRPLEHRRVTGGVSMTLDNFHAAAVVLISGDPAATAHVQEIVRRTAPTAALLTRSQAAAAIARSSRLAAELPRQALGHLPVTDMLTEAQQDAARAEAFIQSDPAAAVKLLERARAIAGQLERLFWERGVTATGSIVASPLTTSTASLPDHWRLIEALATATAGPDLLAGGTMERIDQLADNGWRHVVQPSEEIETGVELSNRKPAQGQKSLRLVAAAADPEQAPLVVETPPIWITTPPVRAAAGTLLEIAAQVWVPQRVEGSVDGLLVFDSYGGPALAERVNQTGSWRRLVLYRVVPPAAVAANGADSAVGNSAEPPPLTVTFALTGLGEARIDSVSVRPLSRGSAAAAVRPAAAAPGGFPRPDDLLRQPPPTAGAPTPPPAEPEAAWPGMDLSWPKLLPFTRPDNAPPPGPSGSTIDPFKRARGGTPPPAPP